MHQFNSLGNNEMSEFYMYWKEAIRLMDTERAHRSHERGNSAGDSDATNRITHAPLISTNYLIKSTIQLLGIKMLTSKSHKRVG